MQTGQDLSVIIMNSSKKKVAPKKYNDNTPKLKEEDGLVTAPKITPFNLKQAIQQARQEKKLSQKQLANQCNLPVDTIRRYENGTAVVSQGELNKIRRVLKAPLSSK